MARFGRVSEQKSEEIDQRQRVFFTSHTLQPARPGLPATPSSNGWYMLSSGALSGIDSVLIAEACREGAQSTELAQGSCGRRATGRVAPG